MPDDHVIWRHRLALRRGVLFLINMGVPLVVSIAIGKPQLALLASVTGMILSFADTEGGLRSRLGFWLLDGLGIAVAGILGHAVHGIAWADWGSLAILAFLAGLAARKGREWVLLCKHAVVAISIASTLGVFSAGQLYCLLGAWLLNGITRTADQLLFGSLSVLRQPPVQQPTGHIAWLRYAIVFAIATLGARVVGTMLDPHHRYWAVVTTVYVMQPNRTATFRLVFERILGTFVGIAGAFGITRIFATKTEIAGVVLLVTPFVPHHLAHRYWLHTALIALVVLLAYAITGMDRAQIDSLLLDRMKDIVLGCALALGGTFVAFAKDHE